MSALRRYEIFLPQKFNDGTPVPGELIAETILELRQRFGAVRVKLKRFKARGSMRARYIVTSCSVCS